MKKIALFVLVLSAFLFESCTEKSVKEPKWKEATVTTTVELAPKVISQLTEDTKVIVTGEVKDDDSFFDEISEEAKTLLISDGCFDVDTEKSISSHRDAIVCIAVGEDAMLSNLQRCSRNKKVYLAEDAASAIAACW